MDLNLKDKVIVVTGGEGLAGSIGQTIVFTLAREGALPVIIGRNDRGVHYEKELRQKGVDALFIKTDMTKPDQIEQAVMNIKSYYGRIDGIVNNVGVNDGVNLDASIEDFMDSLKLNLVSCFAMVKYALPLLRQYKGNILNIGSKVAMTGQGGTSGYAASKGGILGLTREWAVELVDDGIRTNALIISESYTPAYENWISSLNNGEQKLEEIKAKIPLGNRMTTPQEIADTCLFVLSDKSSHTTGQFILVDGGYVNLDRALLSKD